MKAVLQRVSSASVEINGEQTAKMGQGLLILLGVEIGDNNDDAAVLGEKCVNLRIFRDINDKMNLSLADIKGEALIVSQFTLCADVNTGRRPSYSKAALPEQAIPLYEKFIAGIKQKNISVKTGIFGADMKVSLSNEGPVTIILDTNSKKK
jgi:D-tyrosyl-tRNA(Tyr) deacylase